MPDNDTTTGPGPETSSRRSPFTWDSLLARFVATVVVLVVGMVVGYGISSAQRDAAVTSRDEAREERDTARRALGVAEERAWKLYLETQALATELDERLSESEAGGLTPDQGGTSAAGVYADGIHRVGRDIPAGTYEGVVVGDVGYWARLRNTTGMVNGIITNGLPRGPFVLTLFPTDMAVELRGVELTAESPEE